MKINKIIENNLKYIHKHKHTRTQTLINKYKRRSEMRYAQCTHKIDLNARMYQQQ